MTSSARSVHPRVLSIQLVGGPIYPTGGSVLHKLDSLWFSECEGRLSRRDEAVPSNFSIVYVNMMSFPQDI